MTVLYFIIFIKHIKTAVEVYLRLLNVNFISKYSFFCAGKYAGIKQKKLAY